MGIWWYGNDSDIENGSQRLGKDYRDDGLGDGGVKGN